MRTPLTYASSMDRRLRALLRRFGIAERRWIPPEPERSDHRALVRSRLPGVPDPIDIADAADTAGAAEVQEADVEAREPGARPE